MAHLLVPALVERLHSCAPGVRLDALPWQSPASVRLERLRSIDLLISCTTNEIAGFQRETLFTDTEVTVVRKGYPSGSRMNGLKAFLDARHVAVVGRGLTEDPVDTWLRQEGLARKIVLRIPSYVQALQAVAQSDLVAFLPKRLADSLAQPLSLDVLPPPMDPGEYQEGRFYPRRAFKIRHPFGCENWFWRLVGSSTTRIAGLSWPEGACPLFRIASDSLFRKVPGIALRVLGTGMRGDSRTLASMHPKSRSSPSRSWKYLANHFRRTILLALREPIASPNGSGHIPAAHPRAFASIPLHPWCCRSLEFLFRPQT